MRFFSRKARQEDNEALEARIAVARTGAILAMAQRPVIMVNGDSGKIIQANAHAYKLFGPPLVSQSLDRIIPERHRAAHKEHRADYMIYPVDRPMGVGVEVHAVTARDGIEALVDIGLHHVPTTRFIIADIKVLDQERPSAA